MLKCALDPAITRLVTDGFAMPLGVRQVKPIKPMAEYLFDFLCSQNAFVNGCD